MDNSSEEAYEKFLDFCSVSLQGENPKFLDLIKSRYEACDDAFRDSCEMVRLLEKTQTSMATEETRKFVHLKDFLTKLKIHTAAKWKKKKKKKSSDSEIETTHSAKIPKLKECNVLVTKFPDGDVALLDEVVNATEAVGMKTKFATQKTCSITDGNVYSALNISVADDEQINSIMEELGSGMDHNCESPASPSQLLEPSSSSSGRVHSISQAYSYRQNSSDDSCSSSSHIPFSSIGTSARQPFVYVDIDDDVDEDFLRNESACSDDNDRVDVTSNAVVTQESENWPAKHGSNPSNELGVLASLCESVTKEASIADGPASSVTGNISNSQDVSVANKSQDMKSAPSVDIKMFDTTNRSPNKELMTSSVNVKMADSQDVIIANRSPRKKSTSIIDINLSDSPDVLIIVPSSSCQIEEGLSNAKSNKNKIFHQDCINSTSATCNETSTPLVHTDALSDRKTSPICISGDENTTDVLPEVVLEKGPFHKSGEDQSTPPALAIFSGSTNTNSGETVKTVESCVELGDVGKCSIICEDNSHKNKQKGMDGQDMFTLEAKSTTEKSVKRVPFLSLTKVNLSDCIVSGTKPFSFGRQKPTSSAETSSKTKVASLLEEKRHSEPGDSADEFQSTDNNTILDKATSKHKRHIAKLENLLESLRDEIEKCAVAELSYEDMEDDSAPYIYEDKLKRKFVAVWNKLCEITGRTVTTGRPMEKRVRYSGTRYQEINRRIEKFLNKKKVFPDFHDIKTIVKLTNKKCNLNLSAVMINDIARESFVDIGEMLQTRRHQDFIATFGSRETDVLRADADPYLMDPELRRKLDNNRQVAKRNLDNVIAKYSKLENERLCGDDEEKQEEAEDEEEEDDDKTKTKTGEKNSERHKERDTTDKMSTGDDVTAESIEVDKVAESNDDMINCESPETNNKSKPPANTYNPSLLRLGRSSYLLSPDKGKSAGIRPGDDGAAEPGEDSELMKTSGAEGASESSALKGKENSLRCDSGSIIVIDESPAKSQQEILRVDPSSARANLYRLESNTESVEKRGPNIKYTTRKPLLVESIDALDKKKREIPEASWFDNDRKVLKESDIDPVCIFDDDEEEDQSSDSGSEEDVDDKGVDEDVDEIVSINRSESECDSASSREPSPVSVVSLSSSESFDDIADVWENDVSMSRGTVALPGSRSNITPAAPGTVKLPGFKSDDTSAQATVTLLVSKNEDIVASVNKDSHMRKEETSDKFQFLKAIGMCSSQKDSSTALGFISDISRERSKDTALSHQTAEAKTVTTCKSEASTDVVIKQDVQQKTSTTKGLVENRSTDVVLDVQEKSKTKGLDDNSLADVVIIEDVQQKTSTMKGLVENSSTNVVIENVQQKISRTQGLDENTLADVIIIEDVQQKQSSVTGLIENSLADDAIDAQQKQSSVTGLIENSSADVVTEDVQQKTFTVKSLTEKCRASTEDRISQDSDDCFIILDTAITVKDVADTGTVSAVTTTGGSSSSGIHETAKTTLNVQSASTEKPCFAEKGVLRKNIMGKETRESTTQIHQEIAVPKKDASDAGKKILRQSQDLSPTEMFEQGALEAEFAQTSAEQTGSGIAEKLENLNRLLRKISEHPTESCVLTGASTHTTKNLDPFLEETSEDSIGIAESISANKKEASEHSSVQEMNMDTADGDIVTDTSISDIQIMEVCSVVSEACHSSKEYSPGVLKSDVDDCFHKTTLCPSDTTHSQPASRNSSAAISADGDVSVLSPQNPPNHSHDTSVQSSLELPVFAGIKSSNDKHGMINRTVNTDESLGTLLPSAVEGESRESCIDITEITPENSQEVPDSYSSLPSPETWNFETINGDLSGSLRDNAAGAAVNHSTVKNTTDKQREIHERKTVSQPRSDFLNSYSKFLQTFSGTADENIGEPDDSENTVTDLHESIPVSYTNSEHTEGKGRHEENEEDATDIFECAISAVVSSKQTKTEVAAGMVEEEVCVGGKNKQTRPVFEGEGNSGCNSNSLQTEMQITKTLGPFEGENISNQSRTGVCQDFIHSERRKDTQFVAEPSVRADPSQNGHVVLSGGQSAGCDQTNECLPSLKISESEGNEPNSGLCDSIGSTENSLVTPSFGSNGDCVVSARLGNRRVEFLEKDAENVNIVEDKTKNVNIAEAHPESVNIAGGDVQNVNIAGDDSDNVNIVGNGKEDVIIVGTDAINVSIVESNGDRESVENGKITIPIDSVGNTKRRAHTNYGYKAGGSQVNVHSENATNEEKLVCISLAGSQEKTALTESSSCDKGKHNAIDNNQGIVCTGSVGDVLRNVNTDRNSEGIVHIDSVRNNGENDHIDSARNLEEVVPLNFDRHNEVDKFNDTDKRNQNRLFLDRTDEDESTESFHNAAASADSLFSDDDENDQGAISADQDIQKSNSVDENDEGIVTAVEKEENKMDEDGITKRSDRDSGIEGACATEAADEVGSADSDSVDILPTDGFSHIDDTLPTDDILPTDDFLPSGSPVYETSVGCSETEDSCSTHCSETARKLPEQDLDTDGKDGGLLEQISLNSDGGVEDLQRKEGLDVNSGNERILKQKSLDVHNENEQLSEEKVLGWNNGDENMSQQKDSELNNEAEQASKHPGLDTDDDHTCTEQKDGKMDNGGGFTVKQKGLCTEDNTDDGDQQSSIVLDYQSVRSLNPAIDVEESSTDGATAENSGVENTSRISCELLESSLSGEMTDSVSVIKRGNKGNEETEKSYSGEEVEADDVNDINSSEVDSLRTGEGHGGDIASDDNKGVTVTEGTRNDESGKSVKTASRDDDEVKIIEELSSVRGVRHSDNSKEDDRRLVDQLILDIELNKAKVAAGSCADAAAVREMPEKCAVKDVQAGNNSLEPSDSLKSTTESDNNSWSTNSLCHSSVLSVECEEINETEPSPPLEDTSVAILQSKVSSRKRSYGEAESEMQTNRAGKDTSGGTVPEAGNLAASSVIDVEMLPQPKKKKKDLDADFVTDMISSVLAEFPPVVGTSKSTAAQVKKSPPSVSKVSDSTELVIGDDDDDDDVVIMEESLDAANHPIFPVALHKSHNFGSAAYRQQSSMTAAVGKAVSSPSGQPSHRRQPMGQGNSSSHRVSQNVPPVQPQSQMSHNNGRRFAFASKNRNPVFTRSKNSLASPGFANHNRVMSRERVGMSQPLPTLSPRVPIPNIQPDRASELTRTPKCLPGTSASLVNRRLQSPISSHMHSPPAGHFRSPPAGHFRSPPAGHFRSPVAGHIRSPTVGHIRSPSIGHHTNTFRPYNPTNALSRKRPFTSTMPAPPLNNSALQGSGRLGANPRQPSLGTLQGRGSQNPVLQQRAPVRPYPQGQNIPRHGGRQQNTGRVEIIVGDSDDEGESSNTSGPRIVSVASLSTSAVSGPGNRRGLQPSKQNKDVIILD